MQRVQTWSLVCGLLLVWVAAASAQHVTTRRVTDRVTTLSMSNLGMRTNVTVIETRKGLVVIETEVTPYIMSRIKEAAERELGRDDWAYVINTHAHLHHAGGNSAFPGAQIVGHETMSTDWLKDCLSTDRGRREYCRIVGVNAAISGLRQNLAQPAITPAQRQELRQRLRFCRAVRQEIMAGFKVANPTITFRDRYALDLGDVHLRLIYWGDAIHHSSIFVHVVEDNLLVGMGMGGAWMPGFYGRASLASIENALSVWEELLDEDFQIDIMIGVHSRDLHTSRDHFRRRREYLKTLLDDVTGAKQQGLSLEQARDRLSLDKQYLHVRRHFGGPEDLAKQHQKNIDTIWALLPEEASANSPER